MLGHIHGGLVFLLILALGMTSSYIIDDPYPSNKEEETLEDMTDEMTKLDELSVRGIDKKREQQLKKRDDQAVRRQIETKAGPLQKTCLQEAITKFGESKLQQKEKKQKLALLKFYQALQHGKKSLQLGKVWLEAKQSEQCTICVIEKLCEDQAILTALGVTSSGEEQLKECKLRIFDIFEKDESHDDNIRCNVNARFRTADGRCNNLKNPARGSAGDQFLRLVPNAYGDCVSSLRTTKEGEELPNPREVSFVVHGSNADRTNPDSQLLTHLSMNWGQFMDHDVTLAEFPGINCEPPTEDPECINIEIPEGDRIFLDRDIHEIEMERDAPHKPEKICRLAPRGHSNVITAFIDASNVYGSSEEEEAELRASDGSMKIMKPVQGCPLGDFLPEAPPGTFCPSLDDNTPCFLAGDERVNENQGLMSVHTLLIREHNRIATFFGKKTLWGPERIYQETRRIIGAYLQRITYAEFLPLILSTRTRRDFDLILERGTNYFEGYDPEVHPQITQVFSTAAYRFGHSLVQEEFRRFTQDGFEHNCGKNSKAEFPDIPVKTFGDPTFLYQLCNGGLNSIFRGLMKDPAAKVDGRFSSAVQEQLRRGEGDTSDLIALNNNRGRERGVAGYTVYRNLDLCNIQPKVNSFGDLLKVGFDSEDVQNLKKVYKNVEDIDVFTGAMLEPDMVNGGLLGPTAQCLIGNGFQRLRVGDRFWHENAPNETLNTDRTAFTRCQLREIRKISISKIICDNMDIPSVPRFGFIQSKVRVPCEKLPEVDLEVFTTNRCNIPASSDSVSNDAGVDDYHFNDEL